MLEIFFQKAPKDLIGQNCLQPLVHLTNKMRKVSGLPPCKRILGFLSDARQPEKNPFPF